MTYLVLIIVVIQIIQCAQLEELRAHVNGLTCLLNKRLKK